jgi:hypothetical protein
MPTHTPEPVHIASTRPIPTAVITRQPTVTLDGLSSEVLLLLEELCEANNSAVDKEASDDRHGHGWHRNEGTVCE